MPTPLLNAHAAQMPRITAEESLSASLRVAVGAGRLRKGEARRIRESWARQADQDRPVIRPKSRAMYRAQMASLGIGVKGEKVTDG